MKTTMSKAMVVVAVFVCASAASPAASSVAAADELEADWIAQEGAWNEQECAFWEYYAKKRADGKSHREALIAVSRKLVHVIYAVLSKQEPYDPEVTRNPELASRSE